MLPIGIQIYLIGFCVPIQGTQEEKINDLQKPCLPRFGTIVDPKKQTVV
jgi:hypothetical protein